MLRADTLCRKLMRRQRKGTRSSRILFPAFGAFGRISAAGRSDSTARPVTHAVPTVQRTAAAKETASKWGTKTWQRGAKEPYMI